MPTTLEKMMQQTVVNPEFRAKSSEFGVSQLPEAVQPQDQRFFELLGDGLESIDVLMQCNTSCSTGPFTLVCDGGTK